MAISTIILDIEGTTTPIDFVHKVLFPYSRDHLETFVKDHYQGEEVARLIDDVIATAKEENLPLAGNRLVDCITTLKSWISADRKHTALKSLQGKIWKHGYENGDYVAQMYDDVRPAMEKWKEQGLTLGIYSSGSVAAQKLLFQYSEAGDLNPILSHYFDTKVGHKRDVKSYQTIANQISKVPNQIMFLSDVVEELDAAKVAGWQTTQIVRPGTVASDAHSCVKSFDQLNF